MIDQLNCQDGFKWDFIGFFDDSKTVGEQVTHLGPILGGTKELNDWPENLSIAICVGSPVALQKIRDKITNPRIEFPNLIHPDFLIGDSLTFEIGQGNIIKRGCSVTTNVRIGNFNVFNGSIGIGHDIEIGDFNVFMPGARISGEVKIGNNNLLGAGCFIKQCLKIGNRVTVSPLSALLTNPKPESTYIGNPARLFRI